MVYWLERFGTGGHARTSTLEVSPNAERLLPELLAIPRADREYLARRLSDTVEDDPTEVRAAWVGELKRRVEEIKSGKVVGIPAEEVDREATELFPRVEEIKSGKVVRIPAEEVFRRMREKHP